MQKLVEKSDEKACNYYKSKYRTNSFLTNHRRRVVSDIFFVRRSKAEGVRNTRLLSQVGISIYGYFRTRDTKFHLTSWLLRLLRKACT